METNSPSQQVLNPIGVSGRENSYLRVVLSRLLAFRIFIRLMRVLFIFCHFSSGSHYPRS